MSFKGGRLSFDVKREIVFVSQHKITGRKFCLKADVAVEVGRLELSIGNLRYEIRDKGITVFDRNIVIYQNDTEPVKDIIVESFGEGNVSTRFHSHERLLEIVRVDIPVPAGITMKVSEGSKGVVGPWVWMRGYE